LLQLRRLAIGDFSVEAAEPLATLLEHGQRREIEPWLITPAKLLARLPAVLLAPAQISAVRAGQPLPDSTNEARTAECWLRLLNSEGLLVAMAQAIKSEQGWRLQPRILLVE